MKAITCPRYGPPTVLQVCEMPTPSPGAHELLIRVRAVEATKSDCEMRNGHFAVQWFWLPLRLALGITRPRQPILGAYFAGEVAAVGAAVMGFAVGDEVIGAAGLRLGAYAAYLTLPATAALARKPRHMSFVDAAALPFGGLNALHFMRRAQIQPGETVLIIGAGGSIGAHAIQIAKAMGADVTVVDAPHKRGLLALGADHFIDHTREDFRTRGRAWDVVFNMVAHSPMGHSLQVLRPGGRYVTGNPTLAVMARCLFTNAFTDKKASFAFAPETSQGLQALCEMVDHGQIRSIVDTAYRLDDAVLAHERVEREQRVGAIVLQVAADD